MRSGGRTRAGSDRLGERRRPKVGLGRRLGGHLHHYSLLSAGRRQLFEHLNHKLYDLLPASSLELRFGTRQLTSLAHAVNLFSFFP